MIRESWRPEKVPLFCAGLWATFKLYYMYHSPGPNRTTLCNHTHTHIYSFHTNILGQDGVTRVTGLTMLRYNQHVFRRTTGHRWRNMRIETLQWKLCYLRVSCQVRNALCKVWAEHKLWHRRFHRAVDTVCAQIWHTYDVRMVRPPSQNWSTQLKPRKWPALPHN